MVELNIEILAFADSRWKFGKSGNTTTFLETFLFVEICAMNSDKWKNIIMF